MEVNVCPGGMKCERREKMETNGNRKSWKKKKEKKKGGGNKEGNPEEMN